MVRVKYVARSAMGALMISLPFSAQMSIGAFAAPAVHSVRLALASQDPVVDDGPVYAVDSITLEYIRQSAAHPAVDALSSAEFQLAVLDGAYVLPRPGLPQETLTLESFTRGDTKHIRLSGLQHILEILVLELNARQLISVFVAPDPMQIDETGRDLREGDTSLRLLIATGVVSQVRTLASGERLSSDIAEDNRVDHPVHSRIRERSPIQSAGTTSEGEIDIVRKDILDDYIFFLSRHPGRRVDVALSPSLDPGMVTLDYDINENRPLTIYSQISNTGTRQTSRLRERFGFFHSQLTNNDDILSFDYSTTNFENSHAATISYEAPIALSDRVRWRAYGMWSNFTASEVGFFGDSFTGESWSVGAELASNIYQNREMFVDLVVGARYDDIRVDNEAFGIFGDEEFLIPYIGVRLERSTEWFSTQGSLAFEIQANRINDADVDQLTALGRLDPSNQWVVMQWDLAHSFYLEPVLDRAAWEDPSSPKSSTLAHEIALSFRGQHSFGDRLIPQAEGVAGGLYSVRGYPESIAVGDTLLLGSAEYRFHIPRVFDVQSEPGNLFGEAFRYAPQYVYGVPDWDLVLKGFVDVGRTIQANRASFESDETLLGVGIGAELQIRRNVNVRVDWGFALEGTDSGDVDSGSNRVHFVASFLF